MKDVTRLYDQLEVDERFRLILQAAARDDDAEISRLFSASPWVPMRQKDFAGRMEATSRLVAIFSQEWLQDQARVQMLDAMLDMLADSELEPWEDVVEAFRQALRQRLRTTWEAFQRGSQQELGVDFATVLKSYNLPPDLNLDMLEWTEGAEVDRDSAAWMADQVQRVLRSDSGLIGEAAS